MDFRRSSKARLTRHDTGRFPGQTLFDRIGRATCSAGCLPRDAIDQAYIDTKTGWDVSKYVPYRLP